MNTPDSLAYQEIDKANLNKPMRELICPRCEAKAAKRDTELSEHPGVFECSSCGHSFMA